ncbi:lipopolysaccharide biosynthesis protein [Nocardioides sp. CFH 31398]|uniref:lipopolysaccharide biosynthesis protein n=1 Tax=Nocardioides sp. CFH 31398 TaxID=2919579 RepID=UPI001F06B403|nr:hypothetical protein [Nocardioides sp. CFH 31398]MCH1865995.1 hypothetical protein [Nocardioides sp. CFH 31398]
MKGGGRSARAARNVVVGLLVQVLLLGANVLARAVFVATLPIDFLGLNTLFLSIFAVLSIADLGLSSALTYALYRPLAAGDVGSVTAIVRYAGRIYRRVSLIVFCLGLLLVPFLAELSNTVHPVRGLEVYYIILLGNVSLTFLMAHRVVLLTADQRYDITRLYFLGAETARIGGQIAVLVLYQSYLGFVIIQAMATVAYNLALYVVVGRRYPFLREPTWLAESERSEIVASMRAMVVYRVSGVMINNTDPIIISVVSGAAVLGLYSNYLLITGSLIILAETFFRGVSAGLGDLYARGSPEHSGLALNELNVVSLWLAAVMGLGVLLCVPDLIAVWLGEDLLLPLSVLVAAALNIYLYGSTMAVLTFRELTGAFRRAKFVLAGTALTNLLLSYLLGQHFGVTGVLVATLLARLLTNYWFEPLLLFRNYVEGSLRRYFIRQFLYTVFVGLIGACLWWTVPRGGDDGVLVKVVLNAFLVMVLVTLGTALIFWRTTEGRSIRSRAVSLRLRR